MAGRFEGPLGGEYTVILSVLESRPRRRSGVTGTPGGPRGILLTAGGVGIFQLSRGPIAGLAPLLAENIDLARPVVLRRKSVLPPDCIGMGSEI